MFNFRQYVHADSPLKSIFSSPSSLPSQDPQEPQPPASEKAQEKEEPRPRNDNPRTTAAGFDPEALERGVEALKVISKSPQAKKVCFVCYAAFWIRSCRIGWEFCLKI